MKITMHSIWFSIGIPKMEKNRRIRFNIRTLKESIESRRAFQHMANILLLCSLFASGSSEKGELWGQRVSVPLCIFTSSEWGMAGKYVSPWNSSLLHPFSTGDLRYHPNIFSPQAKGNKTEFFSSTSPSPYSDTLSLQRFPDIFISMETTASA